MLYPALHRLERLGRVEVRWEVAESGRRCREGRPHRLPSASRRSAARSPPSSDGGRATSPSAPRGPRSSSSPSRRCSGSA